MNTKRKNDPNDISSNNKKQKTKFVNNNNKVHMNQICPGNSKLKLNTLECKSKKELIQTIKQLNIHIHDMHMFDFTLREEHSNKIVKNFKYNKHINSITKDSIWCWLNENRDKNTYNHKLFLKYKPMLLDIDVVCKVIKNVGRYGDRKNQQFFLYWLNVYLELVLDKKTEGSGWIEWNGWYNILGPESMFCQKINKLISAFKGVKLFNFFLLDDKDVLNYVEITLKHLRDTIGGDNFDKMLSIISPPGIGNIYDSKGVDFFLKYGNPNFLMYGLRTNNSLYILGSRLDYCDTITLTYLHRIDNLILRGLHPKYIDITIGRIADNSVMEICTKSLFEELIRHRQTSCLVNLVIDFIYESADPRSKYDSRLPHCLYKYRRMNEYRKIIKKHKKKYQECMNSPPYFGNQCYSETVNNNNNTRTPILQPYLQRVIGSSLKCTAPGEMLDFFV